MPKTPVTDACYPKIAELLTVAQGQDRILASIAVIVESEPMPLPLGLGRVLSSDIHSPIDIPPQRNAAMDGYAFASEDLSAQSITRLEVAGVSWAGKPFDGELAAQQCVRIFTGAVVPEFADSVVMQEQVEVVDNAILLKPDVVRGANIRAAGSDVKQRQLLLQAPKKLSAIDLGLLASAGIETITVKRRLRIGIFSTGDELVKSGQSLAPGKIYDSNRLMLNGLLNDHNHEVTDLGIVADDRIQLEQLLTRSAKAFDVLISSGGASVGDADFVKSALENCGKVNFWKLAIKPGKPIAFGKIGACHYFGLPGNPVAVLVTYREFVAAALQKLAGVQPEKPLCFQARCDSKLRKAPGRQEYQRGMLRQSAHGEFTVTAAGHQESHQLQIASQANCFIILDSDRCAVEPGEIVLVEPFSTFSQ